MQTAEQFAERQVAFKVLTELRGQCAAGRLATFRGETIPDQQHLLAQAAELMRAEKRFADAMAPFVGWGEPL